MISPLKAPFITALALSTMTVVGAFAQSIQSIDVQGNERVESTTVRNYLSVTTGDEYQPRMANSMIKTLYSTGLFEHVEVFWNGKDLSISVKENPLVNKIAFEGNDEIDDDILKEIVSLRSRSIYTPGKIQRDVTEVQAAYRSRGFYLTDVKPQIIKRDQNRVDVVYNISEGEKTKIRRISFVGNDKFSDGDLRGIIRTKESAWWRFISSADVYHPEKVEVDKDLLRKFYLEHGFADFNIVSAVTELSKDKKNFFITFTMHEGPVYDFGNVDVNVAAKEQGIDEESLKTQLNIEAGERYNGRLVEDNIDDLIDYLGSQGFAFLDVQPEFSQDEAEKKVGVTFNVVPGPRVYIDRVNITGNDRTRDEVIRRELRFAEGDAFSSTKLKRSKDRLTYLGFFEGVQVTRQETDDPDRMDLNIQVAEQSTGEVNLGAGFSTYEGALASASVRERNFLGRGQDVNVDFALSGKRQDFNISFFEPYFLRKELGAGFDIFNERRDFQSEASYDLARTGGALKLATKLNEVTRNTISLGYKDVKIENVDSSASQFVQRDEGKQNSITLSNTLALDTRDSRLLPTHGYRTALNIDYSGLGGDVDYIRTTVDGAWHRRLARNDDYILSVGGRAGYINDLGQTLPLYENFQAGGNSLRGFDTGGIGPRDTTTGDALGGRMMAGHNIELSFPLGAELKEMGVRGLVFQDGGIVTDFDDGGLAGVTDSKKYRLTAGVGAYWQSPLGPLRFELGFPISKAAEDEKQIFSFSFGTRF